MAALLASLLSLPRLFAGDYADGTLEQIALSPVPARGARLRQDHRALADDRPAGRAARAARSASSTRWKAKRSPCSPPRSSSARRSCRCWAPSAPRSRSALRASGSLLALLILPLVRSGADLRRRARWMPRARDLARPRICRCSARDCSSRASARRSPPRPPCGSRSTEALNAMATHLVPSSASPADVLTRSRGKLIPVVRRERRRCSPSSDSSIGLVAAPTDAQQGDAYRIIFIHVPAAWMSMFLYVVMALLERGGARLQHAALRDDGAGDRADGRA